VKCPKCNAWTDVLETRSPRRKRECANGHRFSTMELVEDDYLKLLLEIKERDRKYQIGKQRLIEMGYLTPTPTPTP
jgi:transcriptional regulator NrdR family protein